MERDLQLQEAQLLAAQDRAADAAFGKMMQAQLEQVCWPLEACCPPGHQTGAFCCTILAGSRSMRTAEHGMASAGAITGPMLGMSSGAQLAFATL